MGLLPAQPAVARASDKAMPGVTPTARFDWPLYFVIILALLFNQGARFPFACTGNHGSKAWHIEAQNRLIEVSDWYIIPWLSWHAVD